MAPPITREFRKNLILSVLRMNISCPFMVSMLANCQRRVPSHLIDIQQNDICNSCKIVTGRFKKIQKSFI
jgi:hypothetical protein